MAEWQGIVVATAKEYLKGAADNTLRDHPLLALLQKYGRIKTNQKGIDRTWNVQFAEHAFNDYGDMAALNFARTDLYKQANFDVRMYVATDAVSYKEAEMCDGPVAIVNRFKETIPKLIKSATNRLPRELFVDGYAAGNGNRLCGLESAFGLAAGGTVAGDWIAKNDDTYMGLSTAVGAEGGSWDANLATALRPNASIAKDWPYGKGDPEFHYWTPRVINYTSTAWTGSAGTWATTGRDAVRRGLSTATHGGGKASKPGIVLLATDLIDDFKKQNDGKIQINTPSKEMEDLGFPDAMTFEGASLMADCDVPAGSGYALNVNEMELLITTDDLFFTKGPTLDDLVYKFICGLIGNMRFNPKYQAKFAAVA